MKKIHAKQKRVIEILPNIAKCVNGKAVMIGGTALSLFYLNHRMSIDIDLAVEKDSDKFSQEVKGCLSKTGFEAKRTTYTNVFTVNFPETAVRIEFMELSLKPNEINEFPSGNAIMKVATLPKLLELKETAYKERKLHRDVFDIWAILRHQKKDMDLLENIIKTHGLPKDDESYLKMMGISDEEIKTFLKVIQNASA
jgi:predicted nucleotidyltransferase component of viral defense system